MKNVLYIIKVVALACAAGVIMTILGAFPPLSFLYNWLVGHGLQNVWVGLMAGVIAICVSLYAPREKETEVSDLRSVRLRGLDALTNQKSRGNLIPRLFLCVYRLLMNFSIRSNPSFRSASE